MPESDAAAWDTNHNDSQLIEEDVDSALQKVGPCRTGQGRARSHLFQVTVDNMRKAVFSSVAANIFLGLGLILGQGTTLHAQISTATVSGIVTDNAGARLPATKIVVTNTETGL